MLKKCKGYVPLMKPNKSTFSTDKEIKSLKPSNKEYILSDALSKGLQLVVRADGGKQWVFRYSSPILKDKQGKALRRRTGFGTYPIISLEMARNRAFELKKEIAIGIDPLEVKQELKSQIELDDKSQFHKVVYQWIEEVISKKNATETIKDKKRTFERDLFSYFCTYDEERNILSSKPIKEIHHSEILKALKEKSITAKETARRLLADCNRLWIFAISHGYCDNNIIANISRETLPSVEKKNLAKITDEKILGLLLRDIDNYKNSPIVRNALRLLPHTMLRAQNLTTLRWEMIDFENKILTIPRSEMKVKNQNLNDFMLPLTDTAISILKDIQPITGWSKWVFHGVANFNKPMSRESCNKALQIMGYDNAIVGTKQTIHSFRGTFRSIIETYAHEHKATFEVKESILDHHEKSEVVRAYTHKANYTEQARELLEWWERFLERVKN